MDLTEAGEQIPQDLLDAGHSGYGGYGIRHDIFRSNEDRKGHIGDVLCLHEIRNAQRIPNRFGLNPSVVCVSAGRKHLLEKRALSLAGNPGQASDLVKRDIH